MYQSLLYAGQEDQLIAKYEGDTHSSSWRIVQDHHLKKKLAHIGTLLLVSL